MADDADGDDVGGAAEDVAEDVTESKPRGETAGSDTNTAVYEVPVEIYAVLGSADMQISQLLKMGRGAVVELDRKVGEPVNIMANGQLVARGEVVVVEDKLGVAMTEILKSNWS